MKNKIIKGVSVVAGIIYFILLLSTENQNFNVENHDFEAQLLHEKEIFEEFKIHPILQEPKTVITPEGELFQSFEDTQFNILKKELIEGSLYWDTEWGEDSETKNIQVPFRFENQDKENKTLQIGDLLIQNPNSKILIERKQNILKIYNTKNTINLYFDGILEGFVIPSKMQVTIHESLLNERNSVLFYSKLKKLFGLKKITEEPKNLKKGMKISQERQKNIQEAIKKSQRGRLFRTESRLTQDIKNIQSNAVGLTKKRKAQRMFSKQVRPLFQAMEEVKQDDFLEMENHLAEFEENYKSQEWKDLLEQNESIQSQWENYFALHKLWVKNIHFGDPEYQFVLLWQEETQTPFEKIEKLISECESLIFENKIEKAKTVCEEVKNILEEELFFNDKNIKTRITKVRRIMTEILKNNENMFSRANFQIQRMLIEHEIKKQTNIDKTNELKLENSKDIMELIHKAITNDKTEDQRIFDEILKTYQFLEVDEVEEKLNIQIFSEEEKQLVQIIKTIGNKIINQETIQRIQDELKKQKEEQKNIIEIKEQKTEEIEQKIITDPYHIQNEQELKTFFEKNGWDTKNISIETTNGYSRFENIQKPEKKLKGSFYYNLQIFKPIYENNNPIEIREGNPSISPEALEKKWSYELQKKTETRKPQKEIIAQNTQQAQQKKYIIQEIFNMHGFEINKSKIEILNQEMTEFKIKEIPSTENIYYSLTYDEKTKRISDIVMSDGRNKKYISYSLSLEKAQKILEIQAKSWIQEKMKMY